MRILNRRQFLRAGAAGTVGFGTGTFGYGVGRSFGSPNAIAAAALPIPSGKGDLRSRNLIANGDFMQGSIGFLPEGWSVVAGNPALKPTFKLVSGRRGEHELLGEGNGRKQCYGYIRHHVRMAGGKTYCMRVRFRFSGFDDVDLHVVHGVFTTKFNNGIFQYRKEGDSVIGEGHFLGPPEDQDGEVRLYFRYSARGRVWWDEVSLEECKPIPPRPVKIAVSWGTGNMRHWDRWLDAAGAAGSDIALMPELFNGVTDPMKAESEEGPSWRLMSSKARQWKMHVSGTTYIRHGDLVFNSAPLFDRGGKLLGVYHKNMVYEPELDLGASPGQGFPVFQTDLGRIGIVTCYDSWFPQTIQLLALKGAELILLPNEGYYIELMHARSADNGVFVAASSANNPAGVWDSGGNQAGDERPDPSCCAPSAILDFQKDQGTRLFLVTVDLSRKFSPAWWGGPMRSAPGGRRCRKTSMTLLEPQVGAREKQWW